MLNSDAECYGGSGMGNGGAVEAEHLSWHNQSHSAAMNLPPLGAIWLVPE
jgi:1,4-alpha-glucan branching enzyme